MIPTGLLGPRKSGLNQTPPLSGRSSAALSNLGLPFDPYDFAPLPSRILATGAAANFPSVANFVGDIFNAPVFVPSTQVDSAQLAPHRNAPAQGYPGRASLGSAYVAQWVWGREWGSGRLAGFEDEINRLLGKRWVESSQTPLRTNINGSGSMLGVGLNLAVEVEGTAGPAHHMAIDRDLELPCLWRRMKTRSSSWSGVGAWD